MFGGINLIWISLHLDVNTHLLHVALSTITNIVFVWKKDINLEFIKPVTV